MSQVDFNKLDSQGKKHGFGKDFMKNLKDLDTKGRLSTEMKLSFNFDDTKAKSIIATREFSTKDNAYHHLL
jgi:hypothetical protein